MGNGLRSVGPRERADRKNVLARNAGFVLARAMLSLSTMRHSLSARGLFFFPPRGFECIYLVSRAGYAMSDRVAFSFSRLFGFDGVV